MASFFLAFVLTILLRMYSVTISRKIGPRLVRFRIGPISRWDARSTDLLLVACVFGLDRISNNFLEPFLGAAGLGMLKDGLQLL